MLIIHGGQIGSHPLHRAALAADMPVRYLSYWEQISNLELRGDHSSFAVDGHWIPESEPIFFVASPRFASPPIDTSELEFGWSEWNASLSAVLHVRRRLIPNGAVLLFNQHLTTNTLAFLHRFGCAAHLSCSPDVDGCMSIWLVALRGMLFAYPERMNAPFLDDNIRASLHNTLVESGLDYALLELNNDGNGDISLRQVHLVPPTYAPMEITLTLLRMFGRS